jgi:hypothetical protein
MSGRVCSLCSRADRPEIDAAIVAAESKRGIARRFALSPDAVERHAKAHLPAAIVKRQDLAARGTRAAGEGWLPDSRRSQRGDAAQAGTLADLRGVVGREQRQQFRHVRLALRIPPLYRLSKGSRVRSNRKGPASNL